MLSFQSPLSCDFSEVSDGIFVQMLVLIGIAETFDDFMFGFLGDRIPVAMHDTETFASIFKGIHFQEHTCTRLSRFASIIAHKTM